MLCAASATAFSPDAQTLFTVVHTTLGGKPAASAACRAGACDTHWLSASVNTVAKPEELLQLTEHKVCLRGSGMRSTRESAGRLMYVTSKHCHSGERRSYDKQASQQHTSLKHSTVRQLCYMKRLQCSTIPALLLSRFCTCPRPALSTLPMMHSCTAPGASPARSSAARMASAPSCVAGSDASAP